MKILFYLGHPAHYHNVSKILIDLEKSGIEVIIYARDKDILFDLIQNNGYKKLYKTKSINLFSNRVSILTNVALREFQLFKICKRESPAILVGTDIVITHIGKLLKIPSIILNEDDTNSVPLLAKYGFKYSTYTLSPDCCDIRPYEYKKISYPSYHELGYLHPNHFCPDNSIVQKYHDSEEPYFIIRFSSLKAHHDVGKMGISDVNALELINVLNPHGRIIISSERKLLNELEHYRLNIDPRDMHHLLSFATIFIGDSQTMAAESGVLGTPFIRYNDFVDELGYLNELENKYKLGYGVKPPNFSKVIEYAEQLLLHNNIKSEWNEKRNRMLNDKIDFSKLLYWFLTEYPMSADKLNNSMVSFNDFK